MVSSRDSDSKVLFEQYGGAHVAVCVLTAEHVLWNSTDKFRLPVGCLLCYEQVMCVRLKLTLECVHYNSRTSIKGNLNCRTVSVTYVSLLALWNVTHFLAR